MKIRSLLSSRRRGDYASPFSAVVTRLRYLRDERDWLAFSATRHEVRRRDRIDAARQRIAIYPSGVPRPLSEPIARPPFKRWLLIGLILLTLYSVLLWVLTA